MFKGWHVGNWLAFVSGALAVIGLVFIAIFAYSTPGAHASYLGVGVVTAFAALLAGFLVGFLFGVPRVVSSGELRLRTSAMGASSQSPAASEGAGAAKPTQNERELGEPAKREAGTIGGFTPSTNLSEVSDWLTKLLLGAGLVQLTRLGEPLGALINAVAEGLQFGPVNGRQSGKALVMAGSILVMYFVLGFLSGYVLTTLWYGRRINQV